MVEIPRLTGKKTKFEEDEGREWAILSNVGEFLREVHKLQTPDAEGILSLLMSAQHTGEIGLILSIIERTLQLRKLDEVILFSDNATSFF